MLLALTSKGFSENEYALPVTDSSATLALKPITPRIENKCGSNRCINENGLNNGEIGRAHV